MKSKQLNPKSFRPSSINKTSSSINKQRIRCSLCDSLLKASTSHRYLLMGKSARDNLDKNTTYDQCCQKFLNGSYESNKLHMICPNCCQNLQRLYSLEKDAKELTEKLRHTWYKTKRLNRARHTRLTPTIAHESLPSSPLPTIASDENIIITVKEELDIESVPSDSKTSIDQSPIAVSDTVLANNAYDLSYTQRTNNNNNNKIFEPKLSHRSNGRTSDELNNLPAKPHTKKQTQSTSRTAKFNQYPSKKSHLLEAYPSYLADTSSHEATSSSTSFFPTVLYKQKTPYDPLRMATSASSSSSATPYPQQRFSSSNNEHTPLSSNYEPSRDEDQSFSPQTNDDETSSSNGAKGARLSRRQYMFLVKLPDQQSLNAFIETSAAESGSRWTWRRTSANSRGYKVYYVCNFSMRRHYHPCPAAMYALFHPEGDISIYSCGQHQHIPKDRLPVSITDETKEEIFRCLQNGMATTDIREHLMRLGLPFGDARKLNNFIKYHKELLRFGTVTNVRIGGTAYRQPQCWAIRRQPSQTQPKIGNDDSETTTTS